jgi:hypothetical protein
MVVRPCETEAISNNVNDQLLDLCSGNNFLQAAVNDHILLFPANPAADF